MLPLPQVIGLDDAERRGAACVWCKTLLTAETARDLGERMTSGGRIWPRGCTPCVCTEARRIFLLHARHCQSCIRNKARCPDRRALRDLALEDRRESRP
ncbi:hypothetical protein ACFYQA_02510 [Streptomyces sp. NPDC005774]